MKRPAKAVKRAAKTPAAQPSIEFFDIWTERDTRVTASTGGPGPGLQLTAVIKTDTSKAAYPTLRLQLSWVRYAGEETQSHDCEEVEIDLELADALVAVLPRVVGQARRDGVLPRRRG